MDEEETVTTYYSENMAPSVQEMHIFEWDLKQQEEIILNFQMELQEEEEGLEALKAEEHKIKGDIQELKAIKKIRREKIQRLLATSRPVGPSTTFLFDEVSSNSLRGVKGGSSSPSSRRSRRSRSNSHDEGEEGNHHTLSHVFDQEEVSFVFLFMLSLIHTLSCSYPLLLLGNPAKMGRA